MKKIKVGKLVRYTSEFLRFTGQYFDVPINGIVLAIDDLEFSARGETRSIATVVWCDDTDIDGRSIKVLVSNLELDPVNRGNCYPDLVREFSARDPR
jgi:hypothetical protein